ncbi:MAG: hypothetical protein OET44_07055, partial [Gammaproteobacteria bacterium]|nr:hypothetical protein [Gammaproteobacteria bacterium]
MLRTIHRSWAGVVLATVSLFCATLWAEVEITHNPPEEVQAGARIVLQAEVKDENSGIELVRAYFRAGQGGDYVFAAMAPASDAKNVYTATLPALAQDAGTLDYYLLVKSGDDNVVKSQNFTAEVTAGGTAPAVRQVILQPSEFATSQVYHGRLVKLVGDVQVIGADGTARSAGDVGFVVRETETVRTGTDGRVVVDFDGDPITVLEEASRLNVKTPSWLIHLAGRAYFAFKRLLDVGQQPRTVANTVALIGIRGTELFSYAARGVALKEGELNIGSPDGQALEVTRDGITETSQTFVLRSGRFAGFDGQKVSDRPLSVANRAHIQRAEDFLAGAIGDSVTVTAESSPMPVAIAGIDDNVLLVQAPPASWLGLATAGGTVVAGAGGIGTTTAVVLGALG